MIFFTSDLHFNHDKEFLWAKRGYKSIGHMNQDLIQKWNATVGVDDEVYLLGDVMLGNLNAGLDCLMQLKGYIHIIIGNHDTDRRVEFYNTCPNVKDVKYADMIKERHWQFYLSHYPTMIANFNDNKKLWNLCGHTHTTDAFEHYQFQAYNVCVDAHNGFPVSIEQIKQDIRNKRNEINGFNNGT